MIDDDDVEPGLFAFGECRVSRGAAIDGDDDLDALGRERPQRRAVRAVSFLETVGDVERRVGARGAEESQHQRRRRGTVDVVVAKHRDRLARPHRAREALGGPIHVLEMRRIGKPVLQGRVKEALDLVDADPARRQQSREYLGHAQALRQKESGAKVGGAEPPRPAGERRRDLEGSREGVGFAHQLAIR